VGEISAPIVEALPTIEPPKHCLLRGCWARWIYKKERKEFMGKNL